jgi:hypothetical protein
VVNAFVVVYLLSRHTTLSIFKIRWMDQIFWNFHLHMPNPINKWRNLCVTHGTITT